MSKIISTGKQLESLLSKLVAQGVKTAKDELSKLNESAVLPLYEQEEEKDPEPEEMFEPLEKELDELKAEFAKMMDKDDDKPEESVEESKDADTIVKEYAEMVKSGHGAEKWAKNQVQTKRNHLWPVKTNL